MRFVKRLLIGIGVVALVSGLLTLVSPKAVHAAVAALIRDADNKARHPFTISCTVVPTPGSEAFCFTPTIPAGEEVVIEEVGVNISADPTKTNLLAIITTTVNGAPLAWPFQITDAGTSQPGNAVFGGSQRLSVYADPGTAITFTCSTKGNNTTFGLFGSVGISGYWVSLP